MSKVVLIIIMAITTQIAMTDFVTTWRPELWQMFAEFLAVFGIAVSLAWYQYRVNRFYIVIRVGGN